MYQVYIVDDAVLTRKALVLTVPWDQWNCVIVGSCDDGEKALEEIDRLRPDIVVTDIRMVRMDGLEMIEKCREKGIHAQFIVISGYNEFEYAKQAMKLEVLDYILKPIDDEELHQAVIRAEKRLEGGNERAVRGKEAEKRDKLLFIDYDEKKYKRLFKKCVSLCKGKLRNRFICKKCGGIFEYQ